MSNFINHYQTIKTHIAESFSLSNCLLVVVSKHQPIEKIKALYDAGCRHFGENKVQELLPKYEALPKDICWHFIGNLQKNKVKYIVPFIYLIQSVDRLDLLDEIQRQAIKNQRIIPVLLSFHIAQENTKSGFMFAEIQAEILKNPLFFAQYTQLSFRGLMGMATHSSDVFQIKKEFLSLQKIFQLLQIHFKKDSAYFSILSMGMSGDYLTALEAGSNCVRIGSAIFTDIFV